MKIGLDFFILSEARGGLDNKHFELHTPISPLAPQRRTQTTLTIPRSPPGKMGHTNIAVAGGAILLPFGATKASHVTALCQNTVELREKVGGSPRCLSDASMEGGEGGTSEDSTLETTRIEATQHVQQQSAPLLRAHHRICVQGRP